MIKIKQIMDTGQIMNFKTLIKFSPKKCLLNYLKNRNIKIKL